VEHFWRITTGTGCRKGGPAYGVGTGEFPELDHLKELCLICAYGLGEHSRTIIAQTEESLAQLGGMLLTLPCQGVKDLLVLRDRALVQLLGGCPLAVLDDLGLGFG